MFQVAQIRENYDGLTAELWLENKSRATSFWISNPEDCRNERFGLFIFEPADQFATFVTMDRLEEAIKGKKLEGLLIA